MLPEDNTALSLNVNIPEYVDLCAISKDGQTRVVTNEHGYTMETVEPCRVLPRGNHKATVRVASSNAQPAAITVMLHDMINHFPDKPGRIIECTI